MLCFVRVCRVSFCVACWVVFRFCTVVQRWCGADNDSVQKGQGGSSDPAFRCSRIQFDKDYGAMFHMDRGPPHPSNILGLGDYTGGDYDPQGMCTTPAHHLCTHSPFPIPLAEARPAKTLSHQRTRSTRIPSCLMDLSTRTRREASPTGRLTTVACAA